MTLANITANLSKTDIEHLLILDIRLYVFGGVLLPMAIIGIILNAFTILVLLHPRMRNSTNIYLTALSLANIVCLINFIFLYSLRYLISYKLYVTSMFNKQMGLEVNMYESFINRNLRFFSPVFSTFQLYAIYLTCAVTIDRFIYLRWPLKAESICTIKSTIRITFAILLFCTIYNLPRWFEVESSLQVSKRTNMTYYQARPTELALNPWYRQIFMRYCYLIFVYGLPFSVLLIVNIGIIKKLIEKENRKSNMGTIRRLSTGPEKRENRLAGVALKIDPKITFMVLAVVVAFFLCQFPVLILNLNASYGYRQDFQIAKVFCDFLAAVNCCVNFLIYCFFGTNFRNIAKYILLHPSLDIYNSAKMQMVFNKGNMAKSVKPKDNSKAVTIKCINPASCVNPNICVNPTGNNSSHKPIILSEDEPALTSPLIPD